MYINLFFLNQKIEHKIPAKSKIAETPEFRQYRLSNPYTKDI